MTISDKVALFVASGFGSGRLPKMPGTWGSLASLFPAIWVFKAFGLLALWFLTTILALVGALSCAKVWHEELGEDPSWIVIDEWLGQWLCLAMVFSFCGSGVGWVLASFILFRALDIFKPWPVCSLEGLKPHWLAILLDDVGAGMMSGMVLAMLGVVG